MQNPENETQNIIADSASKAKRGGRSAFRIGKKLFKGIVKPILRYILIPSLVLILVVAVLFFCFNSSYLGSTGQRGVFDKENGQNTELIEVENEEGEKIYVTEGNKEENEIKEKFYSFYSIQSYYKVKPGESRLISFSEDTDDFLELQDYNGKESNYYLSTSFLMSLNDFANQNKFTYPEQFIKPVAYDNNLKALTPLLTADSKINVKSSVLNKYGEKTGKEADGFWDYGFAPILYYRSDERSVVVKGNYIKKDIVQGNQVVQIEDSGEFREEIPESLLEPEDKKVYLIDKAITYSGEIQYAYEEGDNYIDKLVVGETTEDKAYLNYTKVKYGVGHIKHTAKDEEGKTYTWTEDVDLYRYREGGVYEHMPILISEDMSLCNDEYFDAYLDGYSAYIPLSAYEEIDIEKRLAENRGLFEELNTLNLLDATYVKRISQYTSGTDEIMYSGEGIPESVLEYSVLAKKYGDMYGVDANLVLAIIATESSGYPRAESGVGAKGLMQIMKQDAFNITNNGTTYTIKFPSNPFDIEDNINFGTAYLKSCINAYQGNLMLGIQGYNFGVTGLSSALKGYLKENNYPSMYELSLSGDTGWIEYLKRTRNTKMTYAEKVISRLESKDFNVSFTNGTENTTIYNAVQAAKEFYSSRRSESFIDKAKRQSSNFFSNIKSVFSSIFKSEKDEEKEVYEEYSYQVPKEDRENIVVQTYAYEHMLNHDQAYAEVMELKSGGGTAGGNIYIPSSGVQSTSNYTVFPYSAEVAAIIKKNPTEEKFKPNSPVGARIHPITKKNSFHRGTDYPVPYGTKYYAIADGFVISAVKSNVGTYGLNVVIKTDEGIYIRYAHMSKVSVSEGQYVSAGDYLGLSGQSGRATGAHLHLEIYREEGYYRASDYIY